jgi:hypothetical protein
MRHERRPAVAPRDHREFTLRDLNGGVLESNDAEPVLGEAAWLTS